LAWHRGDATKKRPQTHVQGRNALMQNFSASVVSFIRTLTVGFGIAPNRLQITYLKFADYTASGEFHSALKQTIHLDISH
jgi:hypothetical protein